MLPPVPEYLHHYWDVPEVIYTFGYSKKGSRLAELDLGPCTWWLRLEQTQASLISWQGEVSERLWLKGLAKLSLQDFVKVKVLGGEPKPFLNQSKEKVWWAKDWDISQLSPGFRSKVRTGLNEIEFAEIEDNQILYPVFARWVEGSKLRHFMVTTGHYLKMIEEHPKLDRSHIYLALLNEQPIGFIGGYAYPEQDFAVITLVKHDFTYQKAGRAMWTYCIQEFQKLGCNQVNCGDTVDSFKQTLAFTPEITYRSSYERIDKWLKP